MHELISALFPLVLMILSDVILRALWSAKQASKKREEEGKSDQDEEANDSEQDSDPSTGSESVPSGDDCQKQEPADGKHESGKGTQ